MGSKFKGWGFEGQGAWDLAPACDQEADGSVGMYGIVRRVRWSLRGEGVRGARPSSTTPCSIAPSPNTVKAQGLGGSCAVGVYGTGLSVEDGGSEMDAAVQYTTQFKNRVRRLTQH